MRRIGVLVLAMVTFVLGVPAAGAGWSGTKPFTPYKYNNGCGYRAPSPDYLCLAWTGGYPTGKARAESPANNTAWYRIVLQMCHGATIQCSDTSWTTVESQVIKHVRGYTTAYAAGRTSWFRACAYTAPTGGTRFCTRGHYLGD